jgi:nitrous oxidase accessory protein NosD
MSSTPTLRPRLSGAIALVCLLLLTPLSFAFAAESDSGPIQSMTKGGTITRPGVYVLRRDLTSSSDTPLITIASDGVTLDLNGRSLHGPGNTSSTAVLVRNVSGVRVIGGRIASFGVGVQVEASENVLLEKLQIQGEDLGGPPPAIEIGIQIVDSRGVVVTENVITSTFLGIFVRGAGSGGNRIFANTVTGAENGQLGICYNPAPGLADGPAGDLVYQNVVSRWNVGIQTSLASNGNVFRENAIAYFETAVDERTAGSNVFAENDEVRIDR